ncbi:hypothetical protein [Nocardiopsis tropica]|uniref:Uncharacterized protein n=1 Tax=Nocardiopsis tropica TaxID=109330 RepID=A0ABU7KRN7_9ACTN|nr:hypothetical protein [Nocardiopsis umidischolae]MEE2051659.1 hypothetical protein [Nocardiopsis umidischolae]
MDLTLTEAWNLWWSGQQLTEHSIHGMSVLWAARTGKLMAFLAGCTIVLDIIGSEKLIAWSKQAGENPRLKRVVVGTLFVLGTGFGLVSEFFAWRRGGFESPIYDTRWTLTICLVAVLLGGNSRRLAGWLGAALAREGIEKWVRWIAVPLFFLGFALDYLAS